MNIEKELERIRKQWKSEKTKRFDEEGRWITTENKHHVHINAEGEPDIGNPHVISAMKKNRNGNSSKPSSIKDTLDLPDGCDYIEGASKDFVTEHAKNSNVRSGSFSRGMSQSVYKGPKKEFERYLQGMEAGSVVRGTDENGDVWAECIGGKRFNVYRKGFNESKPTLVSKGASHGSVSSAFGVGQKKIDQVDVYMPDHWYKKRG